MIPAYSPQARGRSERNFGTWQGRLPQELRLHQHRHSVEEANRFLREHYIAEFNRRFQVAPGAAGKGFSGPAGAAIWTWCSRSQFERAVNRDNTVSFQNLSLQIEAVRWRATLAGCQVRVHQHLDGTLSLTHGPHCLGRYKAEGNGHGDDENAGAPGCGKDACWKSQKTDFPTPLGNPAKCAGFPLSHNPGRCWLI